MSHSTAELGNAPGPHKQCTSQLYLNTKRTLCATRFFFVYRVREPVLKRQGQDTAMGMHQSRCGRLGLLLRARARQQAAAQPAPLSLKASVKLQAVMKREACPS